MADYPGVRGEFELYHHMFVKGHKSLPGTFWTLGYSEPLQTSKMKCFA